MNVLGIPLLLLRSAVAAKGLLLVGRVCVCACSAPGVHVLLRDLVDLRAWTREGDEEKEGGGQERLERVRARAREERESERGGSDARRTRRTWRGST